MKSIKKALALLLCLSCLLSCTCFAGNAQADEATVTGFTQEDFLTTKGQKLFNRNGEEVRLKGVNLGAWMIWEDWLCPYDPFDEKLDHYTVLTELEDRFGREKAYELFNTYMDNWITEFDLDEIKSLGFNAVRVPFWYRNFYYDDKGTKILDKNGNWDFSRLEWVVSECAKRELYVVLDMHGAVGYQSDAPHNGKGDSCGLYEDTEQGEEYRRLTDELWTEIATRFKDEPAVAMYDLLNEPMCDVDCDELQRRRNNEFIYTRLYNTVRSVDENHIITMEAIWTAIALPHAFMKGWDNVVYQVHLYNNSDFIFNFLAFFIKLIFSDVPMMMGEFFPHGDSTWKNCFKTMNNLNYSWFLWTYKASNHGMWESDWCLRGAKDGFKRANVYTDSFEEIKTKWGECLRTDIGFQDSGHYDRNVKDYL